MNFRSSYLAFFLLMLVMTSCTESFNYVAPNAFNTKIINREDIATPEGLILLYYDYSPNETKPKLTITSELRADSTYEITLIHEGIPDDSQSGLKIIMTAKKTGNTWKVNEIKQNWKCWPSRGHSNWGTGLCN